MRAKEATLPEELLAQIVEGFRRAQVDIAEGTRAPHPTGSGSFLCHDLNERQLLGTASSTAKGGDGRYVAGSGTAAFETEAVEAAVRLSRNLADLFRAVSLVEIRPEWVKSRDLLGAALHQSRV